MPSQSDVSAGDLCLSCGMCCDNTLYGRVEVTADEVPTLRALGISVTEYDDGELSYNQPCDRLCGKTCEIYADRPWTCQSYNCVVINRLKAGEITGQQGKALIDEALQAKAELHSLTGEQDPFELRREIAVKISKGAKDLPSYAPQIEKLERHLDEHFREEDYWMILGTKGHDH